MIASHFMFREGMPPPFGMLAMITIAFLIFLFAPLYLGSVLAFPIELVTQFIFNLELTLRATLSFIGFGIDPSPTQLSFTDERSMGIAAAGIYVATEIFYLVAIVVVATRRATGKVSTKQVPKMLISFYLLMNMLYALGFFLIGIYVFQYAVSIEESLMKLFEVNGVSDLIVATWSWKLLLSVPFQLWLLFGLWRNQSAFAKWFAIYLVADVIYYSILTFLPDGQTSINSGLFVAVMAFLLFLPYLRRSRAQRVAESPAALT